MPKSANCPNCHKPVSAEADACPACGQPVPEGGRDQRKPVGLREKIGLGVMGLAVAAGALALISTGGHVHQTVTTPSRPAGWVPSVGDRATVKADAVSCPKNELFDALHGKLATLQAKAHEQGENGAGAGVDGCFVHPRPSGSVQVLQLAVTELGLPVAKVRTPNGSVWWVRRRSLAKPQPTSATSVSSTGSPAKASQTILPMGTVGQRAD